jgi:hypothetical protein
MNKLYKWFFRSASVVALVVVSSCADKLTEMNVNPNGVDPASANPNMLMPTVMAGAATSYLNLGFGDIAGVVQHTQKDGWYTGHNSYDWGPQDWNGWYGLLRSNNLIYRRAVEQDFKFHQGMALTMKAFIFGVITDLWGDAPYTTAVKGDLGGEEFTKPVFDSQEVIYNGIIEDLKAASALFATKDVTGLSAQYDLYYAGNTEKWQRFANSLLLRYYMRISEKNASVAKAGIESVYNSGIYIKDAADDASLAYLGISQGDSWPSATSFDAGSNFRRLKPAKTLLDKMLTNNDPRVPVWFAPVHVQWVPDPTLATPVDPFIRKNGVIQPGVVSYTDARFLEELKSGAKFTRHYNPNTFNVELDPRSYVGVPTGLLQPDTYNFNPTAGQTLENQHVSQLAPKYREQKGEFLKARLISAAESHFILAEAAQKGWAAGAAETHYKAGVEQSLKTWGVANQAAAYLARPGVAYNGTLAQIIEQKWIASWTAATEAWFDFRRTGLPALKAGPASPEPVVAVRFNYGNNELNLNSTNVDKAIDNLEVTPYSGLRGKNSQWSKPWIIRGTGKPW